MLVVPLDGENDVLTLLVPVLARGPWRLVHALDWASGRRSAPHISIDATCLNETRVRAYALTRSAQPATAAEPCVANYYPVHDATLQLRERCSIDRRAAAMQELVRRYWPAESRVLVPYDETARRAVRRGGALPYVLDDAALTLAEPPPPLPPLGPIDSDTEL